MSLGDVSRGKPCQGQGFVGLPAQKEMFPMTCIAFEFEGGFQGDCDCELQPHNYALVCAAGGRQPAPPPQQHAHVTDRRLHFPLGLQLQTG